MEHREYKLAAVMFTDIVGFSRMMEQDERATLELMSYHDQLIREEVQAHRGMVIKTIGDAFMVTFSTCLDAVECAIEVQKKLQIYNQKIRDLQLILRIGVHLGDIYFYENDALGEGINIASRLQALSRPGRVTISREVFSQVSGKIPLRIVSLGQVPLKNISREIHAFEVLLEGDEEIDPVDPFDSASDNAQFRETKKSKTAEIPVSQVKEVLSTTFQSLKREWSTIKQELKEKFHSGGAQGILQEVGQWFQAGEKAPKKRPPQPSNFQKYKSRVLKAASAADSGFSAHLFSYLGVNAGLVFLNTQTSSTYPWAVYPAMGWGIGLAAHSVNTLLDKKKRKELEDVEELDDETLGVVKSFQNTRSGFWSHFATNVMIGGLLAWINLYHGPGFLWSLIPIGVLSVGLFGHLGAYLGQRKQAKELMKNLKKGPPKQKDGTPVDPQVYRAESLRLAILGQLEKMKDQSLKDELLPMMDQYVSQIANLRKMSIEIEEILSLTPANWEDERQSLQASIKDSGSLALRQEYQRSLDDLLRQKKSYDDLYDQNEIIGLRVESSLKGLRQVQIDLARIKSASGGGAPSISMQLRARNEEMTRYVEDFRQGLKDLD